MSDRPVHQWVTDNVPAELLESSLFVFNISIGSPIARICRTCNLQWPGDVSYCSQCSNTMLDDVFKTVKAEIFPDVNLNYNKIEYQLEQIPSQFAYWATIKAETELYVASLEKQLKIVRAIVEEELVMYCSTHGLKYTVGYTKSQVEKDVRVISIENKYNIAKASKEKVAVIVDALSKKADLARSLNSLKKEELNKL